MSKKSETIEIRLSPELKAELSAISQARRTSMSNVVRGLIDREVRGPSSDHAHGGLPMKRLTFDAARVALFALPVLALASLYLFSAQAPVTASPEIRVFFSELDDDGDGRLTDAEIQGFLEADGWEPDPACGTDTAQPDEPCSVTEMAVEQRARADRDADGVVIYEELEAVLLRDRAEDFLHTDFDGNGVISVDEIAGSELAWLADDQEALAEEGITLSTACRAQIAAEQLDGIAVICGVEQLARLELAEWDADRDGLVSLREYLSH